MSIGEFTLLALFGPIAFVIIWLVSAWLNGQSPMEWFRIEILRKRR